MGRAGAAGLRAVLLWSSEKLNVQRRQAPFAHHRGQVGDVGYGQQRMSIKSWNAAWWNIRCGRLGALAEASRDEVMDECGYNTSSAKTTAPAVAVSSVDRRKRAAEIPIHRPLSIMKISPTAKTF